MAKENPKFTLVAIMTQDPAWTGEKRRIDASFIRQYIQDLNSRTYFISGPPQMVEAINTEALKAGIHEENMNTENFTGY